MRYHCGSPTKATGMFLRLCCCKRCFRIMVSVSPYEVHTHDVSSSEWPYVRCQIHTEEECGFSADTAARTHARAGHLRCPQKSPRAPLFPSHLARQPGDDPEARASLSAGPCAQEDGWGPKVGRRPCRPHRGGRRTSLLTAWRRQSQPLAPREVPDWIGGRWTSRSSAGPSSLLPGSAPWLPSCRRPGSHSGGLSASLPGCRPPLAPRLPGSLANMAPWIPGYGQSPY